MIAPPGSTWNSRRAWRVDLTVCAAAGVVLGVIGPFGSFFNDGLVVRVAYWTTVLLLSGVIFGLALRWTWPRVQRRGWRVWIWAPPLVLLVSIAPALLSRLLAVVLWPGVRHVVGLIEWYGQAALIGLIYVSLYILLRARALGGENRASRSLERRPSQLTQTVLCLQMEDHYVRIHTEAGSELVLMSMSQAIAGLEGVEGLRTHRSWWVAKAAVTGLVEDGRRLRLKLINGLEAPVSRARVSELRAAGWL